MPHTPQCSSLVPHVALTHIATLTILPSFVLYVSSLVQHKNIVATIQQLTIVASIIIMLHLLMGHALTRSTHSVFGIIGDFTDSVLVMEWNEGCNDIEGSPIMIRALSESLLAAFACIIWTSSLVERFKFIPTLLMTCSWYIIVYIPLVHWLRNEHGWLYAILGARDFAASLSLHATAGLMSAITVFIFGARHELIQHWITKKQKEDLYNQDVSANIELQRDTEQYTMNPHYQTTTSTYPMIGTMNSSQKLSIIERLKKNPPLTIDPIKKTIVSKGSPQKPSFSHRVKPNNVLGIVLGSWGTFIGLCALNCIPFLNEANLTLAASNSFMSGILCALIWWFVYFAINRKPSIVLFSQGLLSGVICVSGFAGWIRPLYSLPSVGCISICAYVVYNITDRIPRFDDVTRSASIHGVCGVLSFILAGFFKSIHTISPVLPVPEKEIFRNWKGCLLQISTCIICISYSFFFDLIIAIVFRFLIRVRVPDRYLVHGLDKYEYFEKEAIHYGNQVDSGTESDYESYSESVYADAEELEDPNDLGLNLDVEAQLRNDQSYQSSAANM